MNSPVSHVDSATFVLAERGPFASVALAIGIAGLALSAVGLFTDPGRFFPSYLIAFAFWLTIALGALFFTMLQHLTGAVWSVVVRRVGEALSMALPVLCALFIPLLFGMHTLFHWSHPGVAETDRVLAWKAPYLNTGFFVARALLFFAVWIGLAFFLNRRSLAQDGDGSFAHTLALRKISAVGMFLFALSITFAAVDWLMSLTPHWYSTIFGVYVFAGGFLAFITFLVLLLLWLRSRGILAETVTRDHYHDLGRLMFAFTVFWAYIAASQYFLIWYANIPEETTWFLDRLNGNWSDVGLAIVLLHFAVPFIVLAFHASKRNVAVLGGMAALLLVMHYMDLYWVVMPTFTPDGAHFSWLDIATLAGIGGIVLWVFLLRFTRHPLVPVRDPKLQDSIAYRI